jgi:phosphocarrier protein FPr
MTKSGVKIAIHANIGSVLEAQAALTNGAEGIGLLRSELCFLECTHFPTENEQYKTYKELLDILPKSLNTVRLLDFGTDKPLEFLSLDQEENPAMGLRALRLGITYYNQLLKPQIRAILRLSKEYTIRILCPMIATPADFDQIYKLIYSEYTQLKKEGVQLNKLVPVGIMVEIPNVAIRPELFLDKVDFFSIGTNDLSQFLMAADRTNEKVANYLIEAKEILLMLINEFTKKAHNKNKTVSICGELASDTSSIKELLKIDIDALSIAPSLIPEIKAFIRSLE